MTVVDGIPDDAEAKERIENLLTSIGNLPSFRDKLEMVAEEYERVLELMMDVNASLSLATNIRHDLAHGLGRDYTVEDFVETRYRLQIIIECVLLDIAGIDNQTKLEILLEKYQGSGFVDTSLDEVEEE